MANATPDYTITDPAAYLSEMNRLKQQAIDSLLTQETMKNTYALKQADEAQLGANRASSIGYMQQINPYGAQNESLASTGLNYSGIAETSFAKNYNAYQNALSGNFANTQAMKTQANNDLLAATAKAGSDKLNAGADYYNQLYNNYWSQKQLDYYNKRLTKE